MTDISKTAKELKPEENVEENVKEVKARLCYHQPQLVALGDLRTLTLGASPGVGDSTGTEIKQAQF